MKRLALSFFCLCLAASAARAQNWPQFRGASASGVAEGRPAPVKWDGEKAAGLRWKTPIPGLSHSSPVVWGERVFVTTAVSSEPKRATTTRPSVAGVESACVDLGWRLTFGNPS